MSEPEYKSLNDLFKDVYGHGAEKRHRRKREKTPRPKRQSIFDNLTPEVALLWDVFHGDAVRAGLTPKLTVLRSRRRPIADRARYEVAHNDWCSALIEPRSEPSCNCDREMHVRDAEAVAFNEDQSALMDFAQPPPLLREAHWTSPASLGKRAARQVWQMKSLLYESPLLKMIPRGESVRVGLPLSQPISLDITTSRWDADAFIERANRPDPFAHLIFTGNHEDE